MNKIYNILGRMVVVSLTCLGVLWVIMQIGAVLYNKKWS